MEDEITQQQVDRVTKAGAQPAPEFFVPMENPHNDPPLPEAVRIALLSFFVAFSRLGAWNFFVSKQPVSLNLRFFVSFLRIL